mmetsp:Transcript_9168/g.18606  ORF Transcript_9168/g.18606 Transcript_9168/m.18606 type:complete len:129 (+) Transcript_9168:4875-5261(+)
MGEQVQGSIMASQCNGDGIEIPHSQGMRVLARRSTICPVAFHSCVFVPILPFPHAGAWVGSLERVRNRTTLASWKDGEQGRKNEEEGEGMHAAFIWLYAYGSHCPAGGMGGGGVCPASDVGEFRWMPS